MSTARVFVLDNYDSFTSNLVDYIATAGAEVRVERNDAVTADEADRWNPTHLVVSPGPGTPADAGVSAELIARAAGRIPVLGVCLGHQVICELYGGVIGRAGRIVHGKPDQVSHDGSDLYAGIPSPFEAGRYHSLAVVGAVPDELVVTARTPDGEVMGVRHRTHAVHGVQFHPESVLTPYGRTVIGNFLAMEEGRP
jgi:anthranilate synthase/aminodeoxychorismate synthase-like glutamine amidotransferase